MASWEYAFAMGGSHDGGRNHPAHSETRARTERLVAREPKDQIEQILGVPEADADAAKVGSLSIRIWLGWAKSQSFITGQCPVMKYHYGLIKA